MEALDNAILGECPNSRKSLRALATTDSPVESMSEIGSAVQYW
jgi:hypothetical protein